MVGDLFFDGRVVALVCLEIRPQQPCPERVVWPRPALGMIVFIPDRIEVVALTWWGRVERFSAAQVNTGDQDVHMRPAIQFVVLDDGHVVVLRLQSGKCQRLEIGQHAALAGTAAGAEERVVVDDTIIQISNLALVDDLDAFLQVLLVGIIRGILPLLVFKKRFERDPVGFAVT